MHFHQRQHIKRLSFFKKSSCFTKQGRGVPALPLQYGGSRWHTQTLMERKTILFGGQFVLWNLYNNWTHLLQWGSMIKSEEYPILDLKKHTHLFHLSTYHRSTKGLIDWYFLSFWEAQLKKYSTTVLKVLTRIVKLKINMPTRLYENGVT